MTVDPVKRPTAAEALKHKVRLPFASPPSQLTLPPIQWLASDEPHFVTANDGTPADLLPNVKRAFDAKGAWRKAGFSIRALNRMQTLAHAPGGEEAAKLRADLEGYKAESEKEQMEVSGVVYTA